MKTTTININTVNYYTDRIMRIGSDVKALSMNATFYKNMAKQTEGYPCASEMYNKALTIENEIDDKLRELIAVTDRFNFYLKGRS